MKSYDDIQNKLLRQLAESTLTILECENDYFLMKNGVDQMYQVYTSISDITPEDKTSDEIILPSGKAIAPGAAAHCLLEFKRTAVFIRGIRQAIAAVEESGVVGPVRILYAGCGPYATLITPILTQFCSDEIQVDFLDINQESLRSAQKIIESLGLDDYVGGYLLADGATCILPTGSQYHILLSETMQACLDHEPQMTILQNLLPQLSDDVVLLPQEIILDARLTDPKQEMDSFFYSDPPKPPPERIRLGEIARIDREQFSDEALAGEITIPEKIGSWVELKLFTTVRVFEDHVLLAHDSSITLPKKYYDFTRRCDVHRIGFSYFRSEPLPRMDCRVIEYRGDA